MSTKQVSTRVSPEELKTLIKQVNDYFDQFKKIYVGRESVIDRVKYAMLQKAHVLFFGVPGTSKTAIAKSIFAGITSSTEFSLQMTAFLAEDAIFGPYNIKKMREEGTLEHNVEKMLPQANFANLDEFLDANPAVLRSLLSALNERQMVKGRQVLDIPLHVAYCSTNVDPYLFMRRNPQAWAVFDRIAFIDRISYLDKADDISEMVKRFQYRTSSTPKNTLDLSALNSICDYVLLPPTLIQDQIIFMKYAEAAIEYRKKRKEKMIELDEQATSNSKGEFDIDYQGIIFQDVSDRRICWASHMMEVNAVLNGRIQVLPEDMYSAHFVLGSSEIEKQIWYEIIGQKVEEIADLKMNQLSDLQLQQLENLKNQFEDIRGNGHDLETRVNGVATLVMQLNAIQPENDTVKGTFDTLKTSVEEYKQKVSDELLQSKGLKV
jgi:hypothetical protein